MTSGRLFSLSESCGRGNVSGMIRLGIWMSAGDHPISIPRPVQVDVAFDLPFLKVVFG